MWLKHFKELQDIHEAIHEVLRDIHEDLQDLHGDLQNIHEDLQALQPKPIVAKSVAIVTLGAPENQ
jgi:hypothetical protein